MFRCSPTKVIVQSNESPGLSNCPRPKAKEATIMFDPAPELSDETLIETVRFPTILRNALMSAGLKSIGEIRARPDDELGRITRIGKESLTYLRRTIGRAR